MRIAVALVVAPVALLAVGCGSVTAPATTTSPVVPVSTPSTTADSRCPTPTDPAAFYPPQDAEGSLPADFVPTSVIECDVVSTPVAGQGVWSVLR